MNRPKDDPDILESRMLSEKSQQSQPETNESEEFDAFQLILDSDFSADINHKELDALIALVKRAHSIGQNND